MKATATLIFLPAALLCGAAVLAGEGDRLPYRIEVEVGYGEPAGPQRLRDEVRLGLVRALENAACFQEVGSFDPELTEPGDALLLRVTIDDFEDRLVHDSSIAQRTSPNALPHEEAQRMTARLEGNVRLEIVVIPQRHAVRRSGFMLAESYRPRMTEDARHEVERRWVDLLVAKSRSFACRGAAKKLAREIAEATAATPAR